MPGLLDISRALRQRDAQAKAREEQAAIMSAAMEGNTPSASGRPDPLQLLTQIQSIYAKHGVNMDDNAVNIAKMYADDYKAREAAATKTAEENKTRSAVEGMQTEMGLESQARMAAGEGESAPPPAPPQASMGGAIDQNYFRALMKTDPAAALKYAGEMSKAGFEQKGKLDVERVKAGKMGMANGSRAERDRAKIIFAQHPNVAQGSDEWVQIENGLIQEERKRVLNGEPPDLVKWDRAAKVARSEGDTELAEMLDQRAEGVAFKAGLIRNVVWNPVTQEMDIKYERVKDVKERMGGGTTPAPAPAPAPPSGGTPPVNPSPTGSSGYSPGVAKPRQTVPAAVQEGLAGIQTTINQMAKVQQFLDTGPGAEVLKNATGPAEPVREFMDTWGLWYNANADQLRADLAHLKDIVYAMSGKALTEKEIAQWEKRLPGMGDKDQRFMIKWKSANDYLNSLLSSRKTALEQGGYRIEGDKVVFPANGERKFTVLRRKAP